MTLTFAITVDEPEPGAAIAASAGAVEHRALLREGMFRSERWRKVVVGCVSDGRIGLSSVTTGTRVVVGLIPREPKLDSGQAGSPTLTRGEEWLIES